MSQVRVSGNASGTGVLTVTSPNTNSNQTLTLPDATTTLVGTDATQTLSNKTISGNLNMTGGTKYQVGGVTTNALAWVNFNGTTSPGTIRAQYNVTSVTKNGTGDYTVNFTNALTDINYSAVALPGGTAAVFSCRGGEDSSARTTSAWRFFTVNGSASTADAAWINVIIFGN